MKSGIYKISSIQYPERFYIGSAVDLVRRESEHFRRLKNGVHPNLKLQRHFDKYGKADFSFNILEKCSISLLIITEQRYIDTLIPYFNICRVAGNTVGRPQSNLTRERRSKALKGRVMSQDTKQAMRTASSKRYPIPSHINGFTVISVSIDTDRRSIVCECMECGAIINTTPKLLRKRTRKHCGIVKPVKVYAPKARKERVNGIRPRSDSTSPYVGVTFDKTVSNWRARIKVNGRLIALGNYIDPMEAIEVRKKYVMDNNIKGRALA